ncbi:MAG: phage tail tape measure protein [Prevotellaceae bacterium]|jgi:TP901 family phage tail tape measure protein|nr:phage tail tape measure protein [Prevotellaceae bacterium]
MSAATQKAADFNTAFRNLANLNLDKSREQINALRESVLDVSFKKGFDAIATANAFNDVQSTTGKYGSEVRKIVEKQGEFARLMQADFNSYIEGTSKSMINFGFGADKLDAFNRSAYATMNVGVVSFDELARVQSVYAGSVKSAMQDFEAANNLFSLFTIATKNTNIAATQTKSLFDDLTKASTIKAFKSVGINMYESNGQFKQADKLLLELNKKFVSLKDDKSIINLKNKFAGSQGLVAMIQAATDKTGQLQTTLSDFEKQELNIKVAIDFTENDLNYIAETMKNKANTLSIKLAEAWLPFSIKIKEAAVYNLDKINWNYTKNQSERKQTFYNKGVTRTMEEFPQPDFATLNEKDMQDFMGKIIATREKAKQELTNSLKELNNITYGNYFWDFNRPLFQDLNEYKDNKTTYNSDFARGKFEYLDKIYNNGWNLWSQATNGGQNVKTTTTNNNNEGESSNLSNSVTSVTGSAKQIRNITVNIDSFNKGGINTQNTSLQKMDARQIEDWFIDACMRAVRNVEMSYT